MAAASLRRCPPRPASPEAPISCLAPAGPRGTPRGCTPPAGPQPGRLAFANACGRPRAASCTAWAPACRPLRIPRGAEPRSLCATADPENLPRIGGCPTDSVLVTTTVTTSEPVPLPPARFPAVSTGGFPLSAPAELWTEGLRSRIRTLTALRNLGQVTSRHSVLGLFTGEKERIPP